MRRARLNLKEPLLICDLPGTSNNNTKLTTTIECTELSVRPFGFIFTKGGRDFCVISTGI